MNSSSDFLQYSIGQKVRIREDLAFDINYGGVFCNREMIRYVGRTCTIKTMKQYMGIFGAENDPNLFRNVTIFIMDECPSYCWTEDMFASASYFEMGSLTF